MNWYSYSGIIFIWNPPTLCCCECRQIESFSSVSRVKIIKKTITLKKKESTFLKPSGRNAWKRAKTNKAPEAWSHMTIGPGLKRKGHIWIRKTCRPCGSGGMEGMSPLYDTLDPKFNVSQLVWLCFSVKLHFTLTLMGIIVKPRGRLFVLFFFLPDLTCYT